MSLQHTLSVRQLSVCKSCPAYTVLLVLADYADVDGYCWPSAAKLAAESRCHRATVFRAIDEHIAAGELIKISRGNVGTSNQYIVAVGMSEAAINLTVRKNADKKSVLDGYEKALTNARNAWGTRRTERLVEETDPSHPATTPSHIATPPVADCDTPRRTVRPDPSKNLQGTSKEPVSAPAHSASSGTRPKKSAAAPDPLYGTFHSSFFALWDEQYRETTRGERYRFNGGYEGSILKRSGLVSEPFAAVEASVSAFLRISERQDKYLAHHRDIKTFLSSWNNSLLAHARADARIRDAPAGASGDDLSRLLAEDEAKRQRQRDMIALGK